MLGDIPENVTHPLLKKGGAEMPRKPDKLEKAREQYATLLRARIAEVERELEKLREELAILDRHPVPRRTQSCSLCGKTAHTKRTCPERGKKKAEKSE